MSWQEKAKKFLTEDTQFRLGFLPSEARNPRTMHLDADFRESTENGVHTLLGCDRALLPMVSRTVERAEYQQLIRAMRKAGRIVFSGCGAAGRVAVLLESAWNEAFPGDGRVRSLITGGDFALIKSVENFEDYPGVGKRQAEELALGSGDVLVGITATGETASVLGSAMEAAKRGAQVFLLICVPRETPVSRLERCRELYGLPQVCVIDMPVGGMALTGSTRMQSSTIEMLIAAAALETAFHSAAADYVAGFAELMNHLESKESVRATASLIDLETELYRGNGLVDYLAEDLLLDILSDTTERSPTFMIPPYKKYDDPNAPEPWAMVRNPAFSTPEVWEKSLRRPLRCIDWSRDDYHRFGLDALTASGMPAISERELLKIHIGSEVHPGRTSAVQLRISPNGDGSLDFSGRRLGGPLPGTPLRIFEHLQLKLLLNTISTGTMVRLGRVKSNYMIHLAISNKKLVDRACRIISELGSISYEQACYELFRTCEQLDSPLLSPVAETLNRLRTPDE